MISASPLHACSISYLSFKRHRVQKVATPWACLGASSNLLRLPCAHPVRSGHVARARAGNDGRRWPVALLPMHAVEQCFGGYTSDQHGHAMTRLPSRHENMH